MAEVAELGGMVPAVESGYLKARLVAAHAARRARIESGQDQVVGVNCFQATEPSPLTADADTAVHNVDPAYALAVRADLAELVPAPRPGGGAGRPWLPQGRRGAPGRQPDGRDPGRRLVGVTTGEWSFALREVFGEYRAPTGVGSVPAGAVPGLLSPGRGARGGARHRGRDRGGPAGRPPLGKPGLDGHSNGVEQIAVRARDAGFEVIYAGIRLTPGQIAAAAVAEDVDCVGLSILSGGHAELVPDVLRLVALGEGGGHPRRGRRDHPASRRPEPARAGGLPPSSHPPTSASPPSSAASST